MVCLLCVLSAVIPLSWASYVGVPLEPIYSVEIGGPLEQLLGLPDPKLGCEPAKVLAAAEGSVCLT